MDDSSSYNKYDRPRSAFVCNCACLLYCRLGLDPFGTSCSSLSSLENEDNELQEATSPTVVLKSLVVSPIGSFIFCPAGRAQVAVVK